MKKYFSIFMVCLLSGAASTPAAAQDKKDTLEILEPIEIHATRSRIKPENQTASYSVITREDIEKKKHMQVKDILQEQLGINVVQTGPLGSSTTVFMRGTNSQSTLVMIDGVQVKSNSVGSLSFANIQMDNIERIEILRGPQSTLWGADAVGGVINIVTRKGTGKPTHTLSFEGGSFETFKETLTSSGSHENMDYSFSVSNTDSEGFSAFNERRGGTENDGYSNQTYSSRLGYNFLNDGRVEFIGRYIRARNHFDGFDPLTSTFSDTLPHRIVNETAYAALPMQKSLTEWWDLKINPNLHIDELDTTDPTFGDSFIISRTYTVDVQNNVYINEHVSTVFGFEHQATNATNNSQNFSLQNENQGYYLQTQFNWDDRFLLNIGAREDINTRFANKFTYKIEAAYRFVETGTRVRGGFATGFRAPSVNEILFPFFGNPNIQPEETESFEVGVEQKLLSDRITVAVTYFNMDLKNQIQPNPATFIAENIGRARSQGIESLVTWRILDDLDVRAAHTWNQAVDERTGTLLVRRPRHTASVTLHHNWRNLLDSLISVNYRSAMVSGTGRVGGRALVRAAMSYQLTKQLKLTARGENLLNKKYEESLFFGTAGISGYAGFEYAFD
ncbi:TonB-dependent receptor plug domain-containing protein [Nitrospina watsonii]|uniref:Vitamin B12 transporter BtuB n=1 Tax=Nitrospina watsonii TaxID=1323948 RepID=A0ABN8W140_9BACT|nr:TonB-dependent receptor [Nitrospina watsonii]CAI2718584.1 Putative Vitamin B12 transporter BtuB [Nitrospina watsonii]